LVMQGTILNLWREVSLVCLLVCGTLVDGACAAPRGLSFEHEGARESIQVCEGEVEAVEGTVYVYATIQMGPSNPLNYVNGMPEWRPDGAVVAPEGPGDVDSAGGEELVPGGFVIQEQKPLPEGHPQFLETIALGSKVEGQFTPVVRFGLADDRRGEEQAHVTAWLSDGYIDYFAPYVRPNTSYDFKLRLDLKRQRMSAWVSGRGDDDWFLVAEDVILHSEAAKINWVEVELYPDAPPIEGLMVRSRPWAPGERVRPHPLAKKNRAVGPNRGFTFQSMRSTWRKPGKHVTIARAQGVHYGFPEVAQAGPNHLVCVWRNGSHTGGAGGNSIAHSYDLGRTWSEPELLDPQGQGHCPRLQTLKDGTLLLLDDVGSTKIYFRRSADGGQTWRSLPGFDPVAAGGSSQCYVPGRILELADGSWLLSTSCYFPLPDGSRTEKLDFYRSADQGQTWKFWSGPLASPPHTLSEPTTIEMKSGRLVVYARESRGDGMPGAKAYSNDMGNTWVFQDLPFPITGRTCADFLQDGRVMMTFRSGVGRAALRAWIGDADDRTGAQPAGGHYNDRHSVGLRDGALHIDNDGMCGQFTMYNLRPPDTDQATLELTFEVQVLANAGRASSVAVPFAGILRVFPDHVVMAHDPSLWAEVTSGQFHTYRVLSRVGRMELYIDGQLAWDTDKGDSSLTSFAWTHISSYALAFGNEPRGQYETFGSKFYRYNNAHPDVYPANIAPEVTGHSIWRRMEAVTDDPQVGRRVTSWVAEQDGFPDQYQLDHIIEVEASANGHDQGYSGWVQLDDGRIFVVNYTDDTSAASRPSPHMFGVTWIRGTFLELSDLPPVD